MVEKKTRVDYWDVLKQQLITLQTEHEELRRNYDILAASDNPKGDGFVQKLVKLVGSLCETETFSDIHFVAETRRIPSHRFVIASRTNYWDDSIHCDTIELKNVNIDAFMIAYRWMYTNRLDESIVLIEELINICTVACEYQMNELREICALRITSRLDVKNCVDVYEFAEKNSIQKLAEVCGSMIAENWQQLLTTNRFAQLSATTLYKLIDKNAKNTLHAVVDVGREDLLFLYFTRNGSTLKQRLGEIDDNGSTALEKCLILNNLTIAEQLVDKGANVDFVDENGESLLMRMIRRENSTACDFLIKNKCDTAFRHSKDGYNCVHVIACIKSKIMGNWLRENLNQLNLNEIDEHKRNPLMYAIEKNNDIIAMVLIESGILELNAKADDGHTVLTKCLMREDSNMEMAKLLIENGANVDEMIGDSLLINEVVDRKDYNAIELLLQSNADVNLFDGKYADTSIHRAVKVNEPKILEMILSKAKQEVHWSRNHDNKTAFDICIENKLVECARLILSHGGIDINEKDRYGTNILMKTITSNDDAMSVFLMDNGASFESTDLINGQTLLEYACRNNMPQTVRSLVASGVNIEQTNRSGQSVLEICLLENMTTTASMLVELGANVDATRRITFDGDAAKNDDWWCEQTILHAMLDANNEPAAVFLIEAGCDVNARKVYKDASNDDHFTPVHMAVSWGLNSVLKVLIERKADLNAQDSDGRTPCHIGVRDKNVDLVKTILNSNHDTKYISTRDKFGHTILSYAMLNKDHKIAALIVEKQPHAAVQANGSGENLLHSSIRQNDLENVLFLIGVGNADPRRPIADGSKTTPLHLAAAADNEMIIRNLILACNDDVVNVRDVKGSTPLNEALKQRNHNNASILLDNGADPNIVDENGENALHVATRSGSIECVRLILNDSRCSRYAVNNIGYSTLHICATLSVDKTMSKTASSEICEILLSNEEQRLNEKQFASFIDLRDADGNTALLIAYSHGNALVCRSLLRRRASIGLRNNANVNVFTYVTATKQLLLALLESLEQEPRWSDAESCDCGNKFSLTQRKHHCRHCGRHVCSKCSETTMPIAKYGEEKKVRVCDVCAHVISTGTAPPQL